MGGFTGVVKLGPRLVDESPDRQQVEALRAELDAALNIIKHRGPDGRGIWVANDGYSGLAHCHVAINKQSLPTAQPVHSECGGIHLVTNGNIYTHHNVQIDTRENANATIQMEGGTQAALRLYQQYDLDFLRYLRGEFSICIYDERKQRFIAARDRYGVKPLFWTIENGRLLVAAEVKAFLALGWRPEWDVQSIVEWGWNFDERTVFQHVKKVLPGQFLVCEADGTIRHETYWDIDYAEKTKIDTRSDEEMVAAVQQHLIESVRLRLRADVPIGIYLSGGIDSACIAGIIKDLLSKKEDSELEQRDVSSRMYCFGVAFDEKSGFDESQIADRTAKWLGVSYIKQQMTEAEFAKNFEDATWHCEHHNFDLNYVAKFSLSRLTHRQGVQTIMTGSGSDDNFAGYPMYIPDYLREPDRAYNGARLDDTEREALLREQEERSAKLYTALGADVPDASQSEASKMMGGISSPQIMTSFSVDVFAPWATRLYPQRADMTVAKSVKETVRTKMQTSWHPVHSSLYIQCRGHLVNNFLSCLGDRTEMAHSIESGSPFLDHVLTDYVNRIPPSIKMHFDRDKKGFVEKWVLREAVRPFVTDEVYRRTKQPFFAPNRWPAHGPLHHLFERLITEDSIRQLGFVGWDAATSLVEKAFEKGDSKAMRQCFFLGQWVTLSQRFEIPPAIPVGRGSNNSNAQISAA